MSRKVGSLTVAVAALADTGTNMLAAWLDAGDPTTRMAEPHVMASITHSLPEPGLPTLLAVGLLVVSILSRRRAGASISRAGSRGLNERKE